MIPAEQQQQDPNASADQEIGTGLPPGMSEVSLEELEQSSKETALKEEARLQRLDGLAGSLMQEATSRIGLRQNIEERWLEDLRQYNGAYDDETLQRIVANKSSRLFVNITRAKVKAAESRLSDMLFPTDDRNWAVSPTPVPDLITKSSDKSPLKDDSGQAVTTPEGQPLTVGDAAAKILEDAKKRAESMETEIDDQLTEARYNEKCREVIHDATVLGTGILKGPIVIGRTRQSWVKMQNGGEIAYAIKELNDPRPGVARVDPWNFFPDMSVARIEDSLSNFERSYMWAIDLHRLKKDRYYIKANIDRALKVGPRTSQLSRNPVNEKRASTYRDEEGEAPQQTDNEQYEVWEYHGPIKTDDLKAAGVDVDGMLGEDSGIDELMGCVIFVAGVVIKAYVSPLETGENIYSVFNYEKDESCVFGYGVPYRMRDTQKSINAAWRALHDNAGLSVGPQIILNKDLVAPEDGDWKISGRKVWAMIDRTRSVRDAMATFNIESHQPELQALIELGLRFADTETSLPMIAQGEATPQMTKTASGMTLLMNSANSITRSTVKNFDDGITAPVIRRFYDWNMQNSPKNEIKGDYDVDARGSSVLLAKEVQAQNLMALANNFSANAIYGPMTKHAQLYRKVVQAMHISADDVVKTDDEIEQEQQQAQQGGAPADPRVAAAQVDAQSRQQLEQLRHQNRMQEMQQEERLVLIQIASREKMDVAKLQTLLQNTQINIHGKRQLMADETRVKAAFGTGV